MISIIMPAFNAEKYIESAIKSVLDQTINDWELIIINDGSFDNTEKLIKRYKDSRIKYFTQQNYGVSVARNVGLRNMSGDFFCFLDADDYLPPGSLEYRIKKLIKNPDIDYLDGNVEIFDQHMVNKLDHWKPSYRGNPLIPLLNISNICFFSPTWMIRRDPDKTYKFHEKIKHGEDLLFFIELSLDGGKYDYVEESILLYRKGHHSAMTDLRGLEIGYHYIYSTIIHYSDIAPDQIRIFKRNARKIIFKSYLGNYQLINALLSIARKW
jgi:glycosyltransferase involved in cell wall biosynthesis